MSNRLRGSGLTCAMLARGDKQVLCAVSNESDEQAMASIDSAEYDLLRHIISFDNDKFSCKEGVEWQCAIPVKKVELFYDDINL